MIKNIYHIKKTIESSIEIDAEEKIVWDNITNVKIEQFSNPLLFRLLGIPRPLRAEIINEGNGGRRIAYFNSGKKFVQEIKEWKPFSEYSFYFNPEKGFRVCYFFDLSDGLFRIPLGEYRLNKLDKVIVLHLSTEYTLDSRVSFLLNMPIRVILIMFQMYLLKSIKKNAES